jgi:hypothetical protein
LPASAAVYGPSSMSFLTASTERWRSAAMSAVTRSKVSSKSESRTSLAASDGPSWVNASGALLNSSIFSNCAFTPSLSKSPL